MSAGKRITLIFLTCGALLAAMATVNFKVDPAGLFSRQSVETEIADAVLAGKALEIFGNINERAFEKRRLALISETHPDYLVIGSSRAMLPGAWILGGSTVNAAVPGSTLEDLIALAEMTARITPRTYVVGVDPWLFNRNNNQSTWQVLAPEYRRGLERIGQSGGEASVGRSAPDHFAQLINLDYFRESMKLLGKKSAQGKRYRLLEKDSELGNGLLVRADGSRGYSKRPMAPADIVAVRAAAAAETKPFGLKDYAIADPERLGTFRKLLTYFRSRGRVVLLMVPYHPASWERVGRINAVTASEQAVRAMADDLGLEVVGAFDPAATGCGDDSFGDYMHPSELCIERLWHARKTLARLDSQLGKSR